MTSRADVNIARSTTLRLGKTWSTKSFVVAWTNERASHPGAAISGRTAPGELEPILAAFTSRRGPDAIAMARRSSGTGRAYAEKNDRLRKFLSDNYGQVLREFAKAIAPCLPQLGKEELYWRMDFVAGALTYAMADFGLIRRPAGVSEKSHCDKASEHLIRFAAAGLRAG